MGSGAAAVVGTGVAVVVAKFTNRTIAGIYTLVLSCVGIIMMFTIPAKYNAARYGGYVLTLQCELNLFNPVDNSLLTVKSPFASFSSSPS